MSGSSWPSAPRFGHTALSQTRKNAVLGAITEAGLDPMEFVWERALTSATQVGGGREPETVDKLVHVPTGYWFKFDLQQPQGSLWAYYDPGPEGAPRRDHAGTWDHVWRYVLGWVARVKEEHDTPDLWRELGRQRDALGPHVGAIENTPFTTEEQGRIAVQLTEVKEYARATLELDPVQLDRIERELDYLIEAAQRPTVGRVDWRNIMVGSFVSLALQAAVPVQPVQQLLSVVLHGLAAIFGGSVPPMIGAG